MLSLILQKILNCRCGIKALPTFLAQSFEHWPHDLPPKRKECFGEEKKNLMRTVFVVDLKNDFESYLLKRISSWTKLLKK